MENSNNFRAAANAIRDAAEQMKRASISTTQSEMPLDWQEQLDEAFANGFMAAQIAAQKDGNLDNYPQANGGHDLVPQTDGNLHIAPQANANDNLALVPQTNGNLHVAPQANNNLVLVLQTDQNDTEVDSIVTDTGRALAMIPEPANNLYFSDSTEERERWERSRVLMQRMFLKSPFIPRTYEAWLRLQHGIASMDSNLLKRKLEAQELDLSLKERKRGAPAKAFLVKNPETGIMEVKAHVGLAGLSAVLGRPSIWSVEAQAKNVDGHLVVVSDKEPGQRNSYFRAQASWPSKKESKWEGDDRAVSGVGRCLALPREPSAPSVPWSSRNRMKPTPFDDMEPVPTSESVKCPPEELDEEICSNTLSPGLLDAMKDAAEY